MHRDLLPNISLQKKNFKIKFINFIAAFSNSLISITAKDFSTGLQRQTVLFRHLIFIFLSPPEQEKKKTFFPKSKLKYSILLLKKH